VPQDADEIRRQLRTLLSRQLEPASWDEVDDALEAIARALDAGDQHAVARERARIRKIGSRRFSRGVDPRLGKPDRRPASETTRALTNVVIDRLVPRQGGSA
jgi:hypothetical protein